MPHINLKANNPIRVQEGLKLLEKTTASALADHLEMPKATVDAVISELLRRGMIHVCAWTRNKSGTRLRVYTWGEGQNAKQSIKVSSEPEPFKQEEKPDATKYPRCDEAAAWMRNPI